MAAHPLRAAGAVERRYIEEVDAVLVRIMNGL
jgi:hypothetical protein